MISPAYRFTDSVVVAIRGTRGYKFRELPAGSVFLPAGSKPDPGGMIDGTCNGDSVLIFSRDLDERAEPAVSELRKDVTARGYSKIKATLRRSGPRVIPE